MEWNATALIHWFKCNEFSVNTDEMAEDVVDCKIEARQVRVERFIIA